MRRQNHLKYITVSILGVFLLTASVIPAFAQKKLQKSPGGYHGELDFPLSWKRYYSYAEWTKIMHDIQKKYPHLSDIQSIGKSRMGRDQYLITISAKATGNHQDKPAMWVDGAIHGNEVNGITCSLYLMWYLLTRYDYDEYVHDLVNNCTFYILPGLNVDANESFVRFPNTPNNPREPFRPEDNDGDGLYDEDRTEDVDSDGELSTMYIVDPKGDYKLSPDKRQFIPVSDEKEEGIRFRRIGAEGYDNDGDGMINEDDIGGPDANRNFPYGWSLQAGNPYPMSEPETRNVYEFQLAHPNIYASFHYHNTGRLIMFQAPPAVPSRDQTPEQRQRMEEMFQRRLEEMRKTNKYAQLFDRQVSTDYQHDMDVQTEIATMGARILKDYRPVIGGLSGQAHAATYYMLGAYSYLIELWGSPDFDADEDGDGRVSDDEYLKWIDTELTGEGWVMPHKVDHPDLGEIWIGGTRKKHTVRTPPARYIEEEALRNSQFVMYCASQFPKVEIDEVRVSPVTDDLYWIEVAVKNNRVYPTASDRSVQLNRAVKDTITVSASPNISVVDIPRVSTIIDPLNKLASYEPITGKSAEFRLKGKETQRFCTLVKMDGSQGWVEFQVKSRNGGTDTKKINLTMSR
ncbi:MAG: M14 family metallopeptidase [Candidatus Aminicenantes bacterium]|nr:M14 family metallopeptidase [Candidatus Aminicenantes bacterium]MDH5706493.1 M14 family metallopeptidase [Candidatus Aminicenantes bacterium]